MPKTVNFWTGISPSYSSSLSHARCHSCAALMPPLVRQDLLLSLFYISRAFFLHFKGISAQLQCMLKAERVQQGCRSQRTPG